MSPPSPDPPSASPKWARRLAGWALVIGCAVLLRERVQPAQVARSLGAADPALLAAGALLATLGDALANSQKYRRLLELLGGRMSLGEAVVLRLGSLPARNLLPLKSGEVLRIVYLQRVHGIPLARGALLTVLASALEGMAILAFWLLSLAPAHPATAALVVLAVAACAALLGRYGEALLRSPRLPLASLRAEGLRLWRSASLPWIARRLASASLYSVLYVVVVFFTHALVFRAFGLALPASALLRAIPPMLLLTGLHLTPLGLGAREGSAVVLLAPYGSPAQRLAAALALGFVLHGLSLVVGLLAMKPLSDRLLASSRALDA